MRFILLSLVVVFALCAEVVAAEGGESADLSVPQLRGVVEVIDGDSLRMGRFEVRLLGIDAPESDQVCGGQGARGLWYCGQYASSLTYEIAEGAIATCRVVAFDKYRRLLGDCRIEAGAREGEGEGGENPALALVREGLAIATDKRYSAAERQAKEKKRGIWLGCFDKPVNWRKGERSCGRSLGVSAKP